MLSRTAVRAGSQRELMRGGSERVQLSMLAARAASSVRRLNAGLPIDQDDRGVLEAMSVLLSEAARSVEFFSSGGAAGQRPRAALAAQVDAAIDAVSAEATAPGSNQSGEIEQTLENLSRQTRHAAGSKTFSESSSLINFFDALAGVVLDQTGHVGEVAATL